MKEVINNLKTLGLDMIDNAKSGHPGIVLSSAPILYTIYAEHMNIDTNNPNWINRDRFVMSAGHGSALLYATLYMTGFLTIDDLKNFRKLNSKTPGHPEYGITPGVDASTGPLGQGIANAVGLALAAKMSNTQNQLPKKSKMSPDKNLFDYNVYVLAGDGDLMEGISYEALSVAGTLKLDNLIILYDSNNVSLDGTTKGVFDENIPMRFKSMGFYVDVVENGNSFKDINKAITKAKESGRPSLIEVKTVLGQDSFNQGTNKVHGSPLSKEDIENIKSKLKISLEPFYSDEINREKFAKKIQDRGNKKYTEWLDNYNDYLATNNLQNQINSIDLKEIDKKQTESLRDSNNRVMQLIASKVPNFIGGSADLSSSTKAYLVDNKFITASDYSGRNINFGVREHAMGAILNGLALAGFIPFGSTFLTFADYVKPAIRMSALMNLPVTYIFTHDSISIGPDGPTHQPIEQLASLRAIPNLNVYRPADINEVIGAWENILKTKKPSALVLSRNEVPLLPTTTSSLVDYGAYIIRSEFQKLHAIIIATGSEVAVAYQIALELYEKYQVDIRVVSMPSLELFEEQDNSYKESILPKGYRTIVIEAGSSFGLEKYVYNSKYLITLNSFGASGTTEEVLNHFEFNYENIKKRVIDLLK